MGDSNTSGKSMEWTNDLIMELILRYKNETNLWNFSLPEHKNKMDVYKAWNRIKLNLKDGTVPIKEIKKKRENLMATYRRQRVRVEQSMRDGSGEIFKPEWPFYDAMASFLDDVYKEKNSRIVEDALNMINGEEGSSKVEIKKNIKTSQTPGKQLQKKRKLSENDEIKKPNEEMKRRFEETCDNSKLVSEKSSDTCSLYCDLLCNKLRLLKENTRDIAMMEIDRIIYNLKQQESNTTGSQYQNISSIVQQPYTYHTPTVLGSHAPYHSSGLPHSKQLQHQHISSAPEYSHSSNSQSSPQHPQLSVSPGYSSPRQENSLSPVNPQFLLATSIEDDDHSQLKTFFKEENID